MNSWHSKKDNGLGWSWDDHISRSPIFGRSYNRFLRAVCSKLHNWIMDQWLKPGVLANWVQSTFCKRLFPSLHWWNVWWLMLVKSRSCSNHRFFLGWRPLSGGLNLAQPPQGWCRSYWTNLNYTWHQRILRSHPFVEALLRLSPCSDGFNIFHSYSWKPLVFPTVAYGAPSLVALRFCDWGGPSLRVLVRDDEGHGNPMAWLPGWFWHGFPEG